MNVEVRPYRKALGAKGKDNEYRLLFSRYALGAMPCADGPAKEFDSGAKIGIGQIWTVEN
jgi:hypothetical protein